MKTSFLLLLSLFLSCNTTKTTKETTSVDTSGMDIAMDCPKGGECTFSVMKNKSMRLLQDGIGMHYPEFVDNSSTNIIKFRFHRKSPEGMSDGDYTEEVYMEIDNKTKSLSLKNDSLQQVKLLFSRMCFCERGSVGYFPVSQGNLEYKRGEKGNASVILTFENNQVPQTIKEIKGTVSFE